MQIVRHEFTYRENIYTKVNKYREIPAMDLYCFLYTSNREKHQANSV